MYGQDPDPPGRPREPTTATFRRRGGLQPFPQTAHHVVYGQRSGFPGSQCLRYKSALGILQLRGSHRPSFTAAFVLARLCGSQCPSCMTADSYCRLIYVKDPGFRFRVRHGATPNKIGSTIGTTALRPSDDSADTVSFTPWMTMVHKPRNDQHQPKSRSSDECYLELRFKHRNRYLRDVNKIYDGLKRPCAPLLPSVGLYHSLF